MGYTFEQTRSLMTIGIGSIWFTVIAVIVFSLASQLAAGLKGMTTTTSTATSVKQKARSQSDVDAYLEKVGIAGETPTYAPSSMFDEIAHKTHQTIVHLVSLLVSGLTIGAIAYASYRVLSSFKLF